MAVALLFLGAVTAWLLLESTWIMGDEFDFEPADR